VGGACDTHGRGEKGVQVFGGRALRPLGRPRLRWEDAIRMNLWEIGWGRECGMAGFCEYGDESSRSGATEIAYT
jgi:hypothetical protein